MNSPQTRGGDGVPRNESALFNPRRVLDVLSPRFGFWSRLAIVPMTIFRRRNWITKFVQRLLLGFLIGLTFFHFLLVEKMRSCEMGTDTNSHSAKVDVDGMHRARVTILSADPSADLSSNEVFSAEMEAEAILRRITEINAKEHVHNSDKFTGDISLVIVVQVHDREKYLVHLIESLRMAKGISDVLLIFSHDIYSERINSMIQAISFCRVLQIFYPHSNQIHLDKFPGDSPNDCPRDIDKEEALEMGCTNAEHPDTYGHYREAKFAQIKHHWWWKTNVVFEKLACIKTYSGSILFLEEDNFVSVDFLHVVKLIESLWTKHLKKDDIVVLGTHTQPKQPLEKDLIQLEIEDLFDQNMAMIFNRLSWRRILGCKHEFCTFDDYNWDLTLIHISQSCLPEQIKVMAVHPSRVFHLGKCGIHRHEAECDPATLMKKYEKYLEDSHSLFSENFIVHRVDDETVIRGPFGGWSDVRDHDFCANLTLAEGLRVQ